MFDYTRSLTEGVLEAGAPSGSRGCRVEGQLVFHHCSPARFKSWVTTWVQLVAGSDVFSEKFISGVS